MVAAITSMTDDDGFREDATYLLLDEARILDGDKPTDPRAFAERLARVFARTVR
jgi:molecular chaperone HtpG